MAYGENNGPPRVYLQNIDTGRRELLGNFPGMSFAPRFSPDGTKVAMSLSQDGNTDIYEMDVRGRGMRRLTNTPAIDTSPCYSTDGTQIVFNSDRGGTQQLYVMACGRRRRAAHQLRRGPLRARRCGRRAATISPSPRSWATASTSASCGPTAAASACSSNGFLVEGPTWAPNGRVLMYFKQQPNAGGRAGSVSLSAIDVTGRFERQVPTPTDASDPAWSPLIPQ